MKRYTLLRAMRYVGQAGHRGLDLVVHAVRYTQYDIR